MARNRPAVPLKRNTRLIRHAAIRRLLLGRYHVNGFNSLEQLGDELHARFGIRVAKQTLSTDLREMGAVKAHDLEHDPPLSWWILPAFNPNVEDLRTEIDPDLIEATTTTKVAAHVIDIVPVGRMVYVLTEARAGLLVAYWISWLSWAEVLMVQEGIDSCVVHCLTDKAAYVVAERLVGHMAPQLGDEDDDE